MVVFPLLLGVRQMVNIWVYEYYIYIFFFLLGSNLIILKKFTLKHTYKVGFLLEYSLTLPKSLSSHQFVGHRHNNK